MKCPHCNSQTEVEQVRKDNGRRRRKCRNTACGYTFHTKEVEVDAHSHGGDRHSAEFIQRSGLFAGSGQ